MAALIHGHLVLIRAAEARAWLGRQRLLPRVGLSALSSRLQEASEDAAGLGPALST